ncbi:MAG: hypothetical protein LBG68_02095, partial [Coriobacteriales bacterium]|nr:hypothetical protein [Coriobacteriales bacterium]
LWQANIPTTSSSNLKVVDLGLAADEYITALRFEYGSVEVGFTTLNGPLDGLQSSKSNKPTSIDWTPQPSDSFYAVEADAASGLKPATYLVSCPSGMLPPTTISSSVTAHIARNVVLYDDDYDDVVTTVIEPFKLSPTEYQPLQNSTITSRSLPYGRPITSSLPQTDDSLTTWLILVVSVCLVIGGLLCLAGQIKKRVAKEE